MFFYLIPLTMALTALGLLAIANSLGLVLQYSRRWALIGRTMLWYSCLSFGMAMLFSLAATWPLMFLLAMVLGDTGGVIGLWASGPLGLIIGSGLAVHYRRGRELFAQSAWRWTVGGMTLVLVVGGLWLARPYLEEPKPTSGASPHPPR